LRLVGELAVPRLVATVAHQLKLDPPWAQPQPAGTARLIVVFQRDLIELAARRKIVKGPSRPRDLAKDPNGPAAAWAPPGPIVHEPLYVSLDERAVAEVFDFRRKGPEIGPPDAPVRETGVA
jgi:hypothetical protein